MRKCGLLFFSIVLILFTCAASLQQNPLSLYKHPSNAFSIKYPAGWVAETLKTGVVFHDDRLTNWIEVDASNVIKPFSEAEFETYKHNFDKNLASLHDSYEINIFSRIHHNLNDNIVYSLEFGSVKDQKIMEESLMNEIRSSFIQNPQNAQKLKPYPITYSERGDYAKFAVPISWIYKMTNDISNGMEFSSPDLHGVMRFCTYRYSIEKNLTWQEAYRYAMENLKELFGEDTTIKMLTPHTEGHSTWSWESKADGERGWAYYRMLWNRLYMITLKYDPGYERLKEVFEDSVASLRNHEIYE